jgi:hypothetical protein
MNPVILPILIGLAVLISGTLILYNIYRLSQQPKVEIKFCSHNASSGGGIDHNTINLNWHYDMILKNDTPYDAISLLIDFNRFPCKYVIDKKPTYIKALSQEVIKLSFNKIFDKDVVEKAKDRFSDLIPEEFNDIIIVLKYSNDKDKIFYTNFNKIGQVQTNTFHKRRLKNKIVLK